MILKKKIFLAISILAVIFGFILVGYIGSAFLGQYGVTTEMHFRDWSDGWFEYWVEVTGITDKFPIGIGTIIAGIALMTSGLVYIVLNFSEIFGQGGVSGKKGVARQTTRGRKLVSVFLVSVYALTVIPNLEPIGRIVVPFMGGWVFLFLFALVAVPPTILLYWGTGVIGRKKTANSS